MFWPHRKVIFDYFFRIKTDENSFRSKVNCVNCMLYLVNVSLFLLHNQYIELKHYLHNYPQNIRLSFEKGYSFWRATCEFRQAAIPLHYLLIIIHISIRIIKKKLNCMNSLLCTLFYPLISNYMLMSLHHQVKTILFWPLTAIIGKKKSIAWMFQNAGSQRNYCHNAMRVLFSQTENQLKLLCYQTLLN